MARATRIYLDACALNRLTDSSRQRRIALEAAAVLHLLRFVKDGRIRWVASSILLAELSMNPDLVSRQSTLALFKRASELQELSSAAAERGSQLHALGYGKADALHLAVAEESACDVLLTTDDRFIRKAARRLGNSAVRVENPLNYLQEVKP